MLRKSLLSAVFAMFIGLAPMQARAGMPVIDVANLAQAIQQVMSWVQQYQQMVAQIQQLQAQYAAITGPRGMENLLQMTNAQRNYLPPDYQQLIQAVNGASATYAGLSGQVQSITSANAVLTNAQLGSLMSPQQRQVVEKGRQAAAMLSAMTQTAQQNSSQRFASLQQLISQVGAAGDDKAIQDLQGRISAEQAMLTNEANKLQALYQTAQAEQLLQQQRMREQVISGHGGFNSRFSPTP
jgi:type IV secretion system protein VirB5